MKSKCGINPIKLSLLLKLFPPLPGQELFAINKLEKPYSEIDVNVARKMRTLPY